MISNSNEDHSLDCTLKYLVGLEYFWPAEFAGFAQRGQIGIAGEESQQRRKIYCADRDPAYVVGRIGSSRPHCPLEPLGFNVVDELYRRSRRFRG